MSKKLIEAVEKNRQLILDAQDYIWSNPETGYKEFKTSLYMEEVFEKLGYKLEKAENIPGFCTLIDTGKPGPELLILGELDALLCPEHPQADKETGAVHCCGHSAQCAALLGIAAALKEPGVLDGLSGKIRLCAVPAEELIEIEYRTKLREEGKIRYFGGKTEFLYRGFFDNSDIAFMVHTTQLDHFAIRRGSVGCIAKRVIYKGVSSHAGGSPWNGCNALYAATLGLNAINSIRETFRESDIIRVHPIITKGGGAVNAIPDSVIVESFVRGKTFDAIKEVNKKVNRALIGGALSLGANIEILDNPGYGPLHNDTLMMDVAQEAAEKELNAVVDRSEVVGSGSTDMGDLSDIMPLVHPYAGGAKGKSHGADYEIENPELACVGSAKWQVCMINLLLKDGAERAKKIIAEYEPKFKTKEEYFSYIDEFITSGNRISYDEGKAEIRL